MNSKGVIWYEMSRAEFQGIVAIVFLILVAAACSAQSQASRLGGTATVDTLPTDMCYTPDGLPVIISLNIEQDNDIGLTYLRNDGALVTQLYGAGAVGVGTRRQGQIIFTGGRCPSVRTGG